MATTFNDKIFAAEAFQQVVDSLTGLTAFSTDFSSAAGKPGDAIVVPLFGSITATTFTQAASVMEGTGGTISAVTVNLTNRKIATVDLTTAQLMDSSNVSNTDAFVYQLSEGLNTLVWQDVLSLFTVSTFGAPTTTSSGAFKLDAITAVRIALNNKKCPKPGRTLILDDACEAGLFADTNVVLATNRGKGDTINEGNLGRLLGFDILTPTSFPTNSISLIGVAVGKSAAGVAFRSLAGVYPTDEYAAVEVMTHNETGLSALYTRHWNRAAAKWFINMQMLYGYSAAVTAHGHCITTATT